jgi:hypothetical protein
MMNIRISSLHTTVVKLAHNNLMKCKSIVALIKSYIWLCEFGLKAVVVIR